MPRIPLSLPVAAFVAALVGFGGTLAIVLAAAEAVGADAAQTSSWIAAICLAKAAAALYLSVRWRIPFVTAWSTPGAALIAASSGISFPEAVGAFIVVAVAIILTGLVKPLETLVKRIPTSVASAMLAGVLAPFVFAAFRAVPGAPGLVLPMIGVFLVARLIHPPTAVLWVLVTGVSLAAGLGLIGHVGALEVSRFVWTWPQFSAATLIGLALPLYLVTMASQNLPGIAVLKAYGYDPPVGSALVVTGLASLVSAPFGAHTSNLAAITAAMCASPDAHPDKAKRWQVAWFYAACWVALAVVGASAVTLFAALPPALIATLAGLALVGALTSSLAAALAVDSERAAAVITFVVTASGVAFLGIGAAFWGLVAGLVVLALDSAATRLKR